MKKVIFIICFLLATINLCFAEGVEEKAWIEYPTNEFGERSLRDVNVYYGNKVKKAGSPAEFEEGYYFRLCCHISETEDLFYWTFSFRASSLELSYSISKIDVIYNNTTIFTSSNLYNVNNNFTDPEYLLEIDPLDIFHYFTENLVSVITEDKNLLKFRVYRSDGTYGVVFNNSKALYDWYLIFDEILN